MFMQYTNQHLLSSLERHSSPLYGLSRKDKETLVQHHTIQEIKKGSLLFREGDKQQGLICIASGKVKVFKQGVGGREQILKLLKADDIIGYSTLFGDQSWHVAAEAIEDNIIIIFEAGAFLKIMQKNADLSIKFLKTVSEDLDFSENRTVSLTQKHVRGRIAESLLMLGDIYGFEEDCRTINVSLSREDIACLANMTTSNAIRTLSVMAAEGSIEIRGRKISILDKTSLRHISQFG
jgi:CRP-like cAMP-binding protein